MAEVTNIETTVFTPKNFGAMKHKISEILNNPERHAEILKGSIEFKFDCGCFRSVPATGVSIYQDKEGFGRVIGYGSNAIDELFLLEILFVMVDNICDTEDNRKRLDSNIFHFTKDPLNTLIKRYERQDKDHPRLTRLVLTKNHHDAVMARRKEEYLESRRKRE